MTSPDPGSRVPSRRAVLGGVLAVVAFTLALQGARSLWEPDEGHYVNVALEMIASGDWMTPRLHHDVPHYSNRARASGVGYPGIEVAGPCPGRESPAHAASHWHEPWRFRPGVPAGDAYLQQQPTDPTRLGQELPSNSPGVETWHADREPYPTTNIRQESIHEVVVPYTGYPGYLDYHPDYLDALVEKCMAERGWHYGPPTTASSQ